AAALYHQQRVAQPQQSLWLLFKYEFLGHYLSPSFCCFVLPVRDRKTSSSVGLCMAMEPMVIFRFTSRSSVFRTSVLVSVIITLIVRSFLSDSATLAARTSIACSNDLTLLKVSSSRSLPIFRFSSVGVPCAITTPSSITTISSAS